MKNVIVNADDLGRSEGINQGIFEAHRQGVVTSATLMVNYDASSSAAEALGLHPDLGVGLHAALTGDFPILEPEKVSSLVDADGRLAAKPEGLKALVASEVEAEVRAQLQRFRELTGSEPTHLDSHHHSHRNPVILEVLIRLANELNCPVRSSDQAVRARLREARVATTDAFDERFFAEGVSQEMMLRILDGCTKAWTEIMCHPARMDEVLLQGSSYTVDRERELEILCSDAVFEAFESRSLVRASFVSM